MDHNLTLITTIAAGFGGALVLGFIAEKLRLPALVGYLLAGILIGPATPGFVADVHIASQLSEIGVMLLMFGVGLHFSLGDLLSVRRLAVPGAVVQMSVATLLGMGLAWWMGWGVGSGLIFGLSLSCASTVVLLKALEARGVLDSMNGRIAVGWLVVEDLACVLVLVLMPPLAGLLGGGAAPAEEARPLWQALGQTLLQVAAFIALMLLVGRRVLPWLLWQVVKTGSRELFTLSVIAAAIGIAYGASALFSVSFALGDAFSVLFFVSVGMLFEPKVLVEQPLPVLGVVAIIMVGKSLAALALVLSFRYPLNTALTVAASLAQIGEFSFILAGLGVALGLLLISIALNPLLFAAIAPLQAWLLKRSQLARELERRDDPFAELPMSTERKYLEGQVVLVGYGQVGRGIAKALAAASIPCIVAEQNRELVESLRHAGIAAVSGNAAEPEVLIQAHIANAAILVIAIPDTLHVRQMVEIARALNPNIEIVVRSHSEEESALLRADQVGTVVVRDEALTQAMTRHILQRFEADPASASGPLQASPQH